MSNNEKLWIYRQLPRKEILISANAFLHISIHKNYTTTHEILRPKKKEKKIHIYIYTIKLLYAMYIFEDKTGNEATNKKKKIIIANICKK